MNNSEKVQAALAILRKRWMETHGGLTHEQCRHPAMKIDDSNGASDQLRTQSKLDDFNVVNH
jgi:hypothetical protein